MYGMQTTALQKLRTPLSRRLYVNDIQRLYLAYTSQHTTNDFLSEGNAQQRHSLPSPVMVEEARNGAVLPVHRNTVKETSWGSEFGIKKRAR